jgi:hypothetical protein
MQSFLCRRPVSVKITAVLNKFWRWHQIYKLVSNANLKRAWYLLISQRRTTPYENIKMILMFKLMRVVPCAKLLNLLNNMLLNRFFQVFLGDKSSRWRRLNNGLPQGSVLVPLLFSLYLSDILSTLSNQFQDCKANLKVDLERLNQYFHRWRLQPNPSKTESCGHLNTKQKTGHTICCHADSTRWAP